MQGDDGSFGDRTELLLSISEAGRGLWTLALEESLAAGRQALSLRAHGQGEGYVVASPVVIRCWPRTEGPVSLATPSIRFPSAARLPAVASVGSGLPGMRVRLYLDNRQIAEGCSGHTRSGALRRRSG